MEGCVKALPLTWGDVQHGRRLGARRQLQARPAGGRGRAAARARVAAAVRRRAAAPGVAPLPCPGRGPQSRRRRRRRRCARDGTKVLLPQRDSVSAREGPGVVKVVRAAAAAAEAAAAAAAALPVAVLEAACSSIKRLQHSGHAPPTATQHA